MSVAGTAGLPPTSASRGPVVASSAKPRGTLVETPAAPSARQDVDAILGMVIFLGTWAMLFLSLFFAYAVVRSEAPAWPPPGQARLPLGLPVLATLVILASSAVLHRGVQVLAAGARAAATRRLGAAAGLGTLFLALQAVVAWHAWQTGLRPSSEGVYGSVFYGLTGFHALHVVAGLPVLLALAWRSRTRTGTEAAAEAPLRATRLAALFWHFIGAVWLVTFVSVYVL